MSFINTYNAFIRVHVIFLLDIIPVVNSVSDILKDTILFKCKDILMQNK